MRSWRREPAAEIARPAGGEALLRTVYDPHRVLALWVKTLNLKT